jgi:hypothetical protein
MRITTVWVLVLLALHPAKGSAFDIPPEPSAGCLYLLPRSARLGPLCGWTASTKFAFEPHSRPMSGLALTQRAMSPAEERNAWLGAAKALPPGVTVKVELGSGRRITGTLISVTDDAVLVKQRGRSTRPALEIPLADISRIERVSKDGVSFAKVIAGGAAAGAGAFLTIFAVMLMISD